LDQIIMLEGGRHAVDLVHGETGVNYVKQHKSLKGLSPAMAAGLSDTLWSLTELAEMVDAALG
jgi:hypothetical protein